MNKKITKGVLKNRAGQYMRPKSIRKYRDMQTRYNNLYNVQRMRHDDAMQQICDEFYVSHVFALYVLTLEIPPEEVETSEVAAADKE